MRLSKLFLLKGPLDDHSRPIHEIIHLLRSNNTNVLWTGLQQDWPLIVKTVLEEDPDMIGVSIHSGDPAIILERFVEILLENGVDLQSKLLLAGGSGEITFPETREKLAELGFHVFLPSANTKDNIIKTIGTELPKKRALKCEDQLTGNYGFSRLGLGEMITKMEEDDFFSVPFLKESVPKIVISGPARAGKSSLLGAVLLKLSSRLEKIGVMLCDPRGPREMGAFLGDRIVLREATAMEHVFTRSFSDLGNYGSGHIRTLRKVAELYGLWGAQAIFIETIGSGQEITSRLKELADFLFLVSLPNETDEFQLLKGGGHEIADAIILNKIDLAPTFQAEYALQEHFAGPYFKTSAKTGEGLDELCEFILSKIKKPG